MSGGLPAPYPLAWPPNKPRTPLERRTHGSYTCRQYGEAVIGLEREIQRWQRRERSARITDWQITATHAGRGMPAGDPGAALWFVLGGKDITGTSALMVLACDRFLELPQNIRALSLTMERLRLVDDVGAYSLVQATEGAKMLPAPEEAIDWRTELGLGPGFTSLAVVEAVYKARARELGAEHPGLKRLNIAVQAAREELKPLEVERK